ncbi:hypothetical protein QT381_05820 [Galbitalea sp. SE-J8]|uniref:hypothetical protein n=1 Tax=Galbitalea sp. SE-J8 TaxID=3054952 RepID=UPI00259D1636|nr:hypothetical protein [Galbitalea sp. SE-J8]MDM4762519.1 hypothetical protein [Galbitalea sp. SE-J8]
MALLVAALLAVAVGIAGTVVALLLGRPIWSIAAVAAALLLAVPRVPWPGAGTVDLPQPWGPVVALGVGALGIASGSPLVTLVLAWASPATRVAPRSHGGILVPDLRSPAPERAGERTVLRGGSTIGLLERAAVIGSIAVGQPGAVAIVIAVKGLGRFSELDSAEARERFIIGTLASLIWSAGCALVARAWW